MRLFSPVPLLLLTFALGAATLPAQRPSSSSSSSNRQDESAQEPQQPSSTVVRRAVEASGSAVSLETSETLFTMAAALNSCGYDNGIESSLPVRAVIRAEMVQAVGAGFEAKAAHDTMCTYIDAHKQPGPRNLAQYVSLALFLSAPPDFALSVGEGDLPPRLAERNRRAAPAARLRRKGAVAPHLHAASCRVRRRRTPGA